MNSPFIVQLTSGKYSEFGLNEVMIGPVDPKPVLDAAVRRWSETRWSSLEEMHTNECEWRLGDDETMYSLIKFVRDKLKAALLEAGFKEAESFELWLG